MVTAQKKKRKIVNAVAKIKTMNVTAITKNVATQTKNAVANQIKLAKIIANSKYLFS